MAKCCEDPTEPRKIDPRELLREQEHYGNLLRDLFTGDPEKLMLKELKGANTYLRELAALRAHYPAVRHYAITILDKESITILERIVDKEPGTEIGILAQKRVAELAG
jgi:hypothetical protein